MPQLITDEMLAVFAVEGPWAEIGPMLRERYAGWLERVGLARPFNGEALEHWRLVARTFAE
jgi:hypothetical protein